MNTCESCKWWSVWTDRGSGHCHRRAPIVDPQAFVGLSNESVIRGPRTFFPQTDYNDFCGEYEAKRQ